MSAGTDAPDATSGSGALSKSSPGSERLQLRSASGRAFSEHSDPVRPNFENGGAEGRKSRAVCPELRLARVSLTWWHARFVHADAQRNTTWALRCNGEAKADDAKHPQGRRRCGTEIAYPSMADDRLEDDVLNEMNIEVTRGNEAS